MKFQATWPAGSSLYDNFKMFCEQVKTMSGGRLEIEHMPAGAVFLSCATVPPTFARAAETRLLARDRLFLDTPTSGGPIRAEAGELTIMASGTPAAFDRAQALLDAVAARVYRLGDAAGGEPG